MSSWWKNKSYKSGFTIIEIIVVVSVIAILATISVVGYISWRNSTLATAIKNDLGAAATALEDYRTNNNGYPSTTTLPSTFSPSSGVNIALYSSSATAYCVDGSSVENTSLVFYIASETKDKGGLSGTCATRPGQSPPSVPIGLAVTNKTSTTMSLSWTASTGSPTSYLAQCASDAAFILDLKQSSISTTTVTITGLNGQTTHYCRVNAQSAAGTSGWSTVVSSNTNAYLCSDLGKYGTYPDCYDYDALPIATSIEGYWTIAPDGFLLEDGSAVSRTTYADLFAAIGTTYGAGDGSTTFNLPDSRGRTVVGRDASDSDFNSVGEKQGSKTDVQTTAQLPTHTHIQNSHSHYYDVHTSGAEAGGYGLHSSGSFQNRVYVNSGNGTYSATATNQTTGGSDPHNIIQPSIVRSFAIKYRPSTGTDSLLPAGTTIKGYWSSPPSGYLLEYGTAVSRTTYSDLFAVIGTTYGAGDGSTTFNLPDTKGRVLVNKNSSDSEFNTMGEKYGEKAHVMTIAELPAHTHIQNAHNHGFYSYVSSSEAAGYGVSGGGGWVNAVIVNGYGLGTSGATATNQSTGSDEAETVVQPSIVQKIAIKYTTATASGSSVGVGTSLSGSWSSAPSGFLVEDGSAVSRSTYAALFAVIGTTYGAGNGSTTFNLPDSRGRVGVNLSPTDSEFDTMGEKYGEKTHLMTIAEMATHTHIQNAHSHSFGMAAAGGGYGACGCSAFRNRLMVTGGGIGSSSTTATNQSEGDGQAFNVIQPSIVKLFVIKY